MFVNELVHTWQSYLDTIDDWTFLTSDCVPKDTHCGLIYELQNPIHRQNESFAIADMRNLSYAEPHFDREIEVYFVLQGRGLVVVGDKQNDVEKGSVIVIPPNTAHFTIPEENLVLAVVNTPPFKPENYVPLSESDKSVKFDKDFFCTLLEQRSIYAQKPGWHRISDLEIRGAQDLERSSS